MLKLLLLLVQTPHPIVSSKPTMTNTTLEKSFSAPTWRMPTHPLSKVTMGVDARDTD